MTDAQWQRVKEITADAFEQPPLERAAFVAGACGGDTRLRDEVLRLLSADESSGSNILSVPPLVLRRFFPEPPHAEPQFAPGQLLAGRFRVAQFLGRGAMGEVYSAADLELREMVALKAISPSIAASPHAIERFKKEVKESRRITHLSVCRVYDLFSHEQPGRDTIWLLTMQLLNGITLADALAARGALPLCDSLLLIRDMVEALAAAHDLGIVHRDFKPSNVMLVSEPGKRERAVVADFGLALNLAEAAAAHSTADGTPAYMAPEQAAADKVTAAADQFALGLVICEILAGSRPVLDRISSVESQRQLARWLRSVPRSKLNSNARRTARRCLQFQPEKRFPQIRDIVPSIEGVRQRARLKRTYAAAAVGVAALALAAGFAILNSGLRVKNATLLTPESGLSGGPRLSRDGKWIVYSSNRAQAGNLDIWIQDTAGGQPRRLTTHPAEDTEPAISPDGALVAFRSQRNGGGLYVVGSDGASERLLAARGWSPVFSPDGRWLAYWTGTRDDAAPSAKMFIAPAAGGEPRRVAADLADARYPTWAASGAFLLFDGCRTAGAPLSSCTDWWLTRPEGGPAINTGAMAVLRANRLSQLTPPQKAWWNDEVIFSGGRDSLVALWALRLPARDPRPLGKPAQLTPGEVTELEPSVAENGAIAFGRATAALHIWQVSFQGNPEGGVRVTDSPEIDGCPSASPDGRWLYFCRKVRGTRQIVARDLLSARESTVFPTGEDEYWPISSATGERVVFETRHDNASSLWLGDRKTNRAVRLCGGCSHPTSWLDDKGVFYTTAAGEIALLDIASGAARIVLSPQPHETLGEADWNGANQHLLFAAVREGAVKQVFAVAFPATLGKPSDARRQLTDEIEQLDQPHWSGDGKTFYFLSRRDASNCVWGQPFRADRRRSEPFPVLHFHDLRFSPDRASPLIRGLTAGSDSLFVSVGEVTDTLWLGRLARPPIASIFHLFPR